MSRFSSLVLGTVLVFATTAANALVVSNSDTQTHVAFGGLSSDAANPPDSQTFNGAYTLQQFNGALGTLNSVRIEFNQGVNSTIDDTGGNCLRGFSDCAVSLTRVFAQAGGVALGSAVGGAASVVDPSTLNCNIGGSTTDPGHCHETPPYPHSRTSAYTEAVEFTIATDVAEFVGAGTFTVDTILLAEYGVAAGLGTDNVSSGVGFDWGGTATVIYDYSPDQVAMPAPGAAAFLLAGALVLAARKRIA